MSGSSASPIRSVVCAQAMPADATTSTAAIANRKAVIGLLPVFVHAAAAWSVATPLPFCLSGLPERIHQPLQNRWPAQLIHTKMGGRQIVGAMTGGRVRIA